MNLNDLQNAWQEFNRATHISPIRDEKHYTEMVSMRVTGLERWIVVRVGTEACPPYAC